LVFMFMFGFILRSIFSSFIFIVFMLVTWGWCNLEWEITPWNSGQLKNTLKKNLTKIMLQNNFKAKIEWKVNTPNEILLDG
jgi:hypothetical protein